MDSTSQTSLCLKGNNRGQTTLEPQVSEANYRAYRDFTLGNQLPCEVHYTTDSAESLDLRSYPHGKPLRLKFETQMWRRECFDTSSEAKRESREGIGRFGAGYPCPTYAAHDERSRPGWPLPNHILVSKVEVKLIEKYTLSS